MKKILICIVLIVTTLSVFWINRSAIFEIEEEYVPDDSEVELIEYFKEIALNTEYDDNPERVIKWKQPMSLFVHKEKECKEQMEVLDNTVDKINKLVSDGFNINITSDVNKGNAILYLCSRKRVRELAPKFYELMQDDFLGNYTGLTYVEFKLTNFVINKAIIFIDEDATIGEQETAIVEEVTQSIGLMNDSNKYSNSVFYEDEDGIENVEFSKMDKELISFLYSDKMIPGYREKSVESVIKKILRERHRSKEN